MKRVVLVTGLRMAKPDPETHRVLPLLATLGLQLEVLPWQADVDWSAYDGVVVRTPWDYFEQREAFLAWAQRVHAVTPVLNPPEVLVWNSHKGYLRQLQRAGVPTVPTLWLQRGQEVPDLAGLGWTELVVKPAVSVGAIGACRDRAEAVALREHAVRLVASDDVMVQPFVPEVVTQGEVSLVFLAGRFSHAVRKLPAAGDYRVQDMYGGRVQAWEPDASALALAGQVLLHTPAPCLYARVDLVPHQGGWVLMELEVIEPELFLGFGDGARAFATAIDEAVVAKQRL